MKNGTVKITKQQIVYEVLNAVTHGVSFVVGVGLSIMLLIRAYHDKLSTAAITSLIIYSMTVLSLYLASTLLHCFVFTRAKRIFQILDHSNIFLLIAGTYTPYCIIFVNNIWGNILLASVWTLALAGIISHIVFHGKYQKNGDHHLCADGLVMHVFGERIIRQFEYKWLLAVGSRWGDLHDRGSHL